MSAIIEPAIRATTDNITNSEFVETRSVTLEWKLANLRTLFETSKGEAKSKCVKSQLFDGNRWQIMFYANSGVSTGGQDPFCSVYLSCEPTASEREAGQQFGTKGKAGEGASTVSNTAGSSSVRDSHKGPWKREGKFRFTFEIRSLDRRMTFKQMEAHDHSFSDTARNWGYASFLKRSEAYFNNQFVRSADAFLIICTIVSSPTPPSAPPLPRLLIPKDLVSAYASLFDDPQYSDVCFRIRPADRERPERRIYAAKKVLAGRASYFEDMFSSGFQESSAVSVSIPTVPLRSNVSGVGEDSDDEEEVDDMDDWDEDDDSSSGSGDETFEEGEEEEEEGQESEEEPRSASPPVPTGSSIPVFVMDDDEEEDVGESEVETETQDDSPTTVVTRKKSVERTFVDAKSGLDEPSRIGGGRRRSTGEVATRDGTPKKGATGAAQKEQKFKRPMLEVVVTDAAYTSFKALLFWLYTDSISFAPLASTYHVARENSSHQDQPFPYNTRREFLLATTPFVSKSPSTPGPCSAKAIYRLADKIGLPELKERAFEHVVKSLTVQNIPYEVFGSFSLKFSEIQRIEVAFLCEKWNEVRSSPSMNKVLSNIRLMGRFPGFEEVFRLILPYLQYIPPALADEERAA